jgi:hypothetical protein
MQSLHRQKGMTMWGLIFMLAVLAFVVFLVFKLFPPYLDDMKVRTSLNGLMSDPAISSMSKVQIAAALERRFDIDYITTVNLKESLSVDTRGRMKIIRIDYEVVVPMVANISALLDYKHKREVRVFE